MKGRKSVGSFRTGNSFKCGASGYWNGVCAGDFGHFTFCSDFGFLEGFCKTVSHPNTLVVILWWKCSGNYLVSCVFGKAWVILESKKSTNFTKTPFLFLQ